MEFVHIAFAARIRAPSWNFLHFHLMHALCPVLAASKLLSVKELQRSAQA